MTTAIIIDDDYDTVHTFSDYMEILCVSVLATGYDGKQAVDLFIKHRPDIVFLDLIMPQYDGLYALEKIREISPQAKVIVITADLRKDAEERLNQLNPTEIIYKPFDPQMLKGLIEKYKA